jgi:hypothetical protein
MWEIEIDDEMVEINQDPADVTMRLQEHKDENAGTPQSTMTLLFECGVIMFRVELDTGQFIRLMQGRTVTALAQFTPVVAVRAEDFKLTHGLITLDPETLGMVE